MLRYSNSSQAASAGVTPLFLLYQSDHSSQVTVYDFPHSSVYVNLLNVHLQVHTLSYHQQYQLELGIAELYIYQYDSLFPA